MKSALVASFFLAIINWYGLRDLLAKTRGWKAYSEKEVLDCIIDIFLHGMTRHEERAEE